MNLLVALFGKLDNIDRRYIYLFVATVVALPIFVRSLPPMPPVVTDETRGCYDAIEQCPPNKIVILHSDWDQGIRGDIQACTTAIMEHMFRKGVKFIIISGNVWAPDFIRPDEFALAKKYNKKEGVDWVDFGYKVIGNWAIYITNMCKDIPGTLKEDRNHVPANKLPMMGGVRDIRDVWLIVTAGYNPVGEYIPFVQGVYGTKVVYCMTAINTTVFYTYLESKQLTGMLVGTRGAAEYEYLLKTRGRGSSLIISQSFGHTLMALFIILGNIGGYVRIRAARRVAEEAGGRVP